MKKAIIASNITKKYKLFDDTKDRLLDLITHKSYGEDFYALTDVSFEAEKGDVVGFVGINGSGKSTLSNIIAGIVPETSGKVKVNGEVSIIAVASGLKGDLTGRDNIELKLLMLGFNRNEVKELEPDIIEFAELEKFIDQPVKSYSSGMKSRLGFAISVNVNPDILIIDEALSVGDKAFAEKSLSKMKEFKKQGKTMIFVSHSIGQMKQFCEKILWLEFGKVKDYGTVEEIIPKYEAFLKQWKKMSKGERQAYRNSEGEFEVDLLNEDYIEKPISRLCHIKTSDSYIYSTPMSETEKISSKDYRHNVYYTKKKATYKDELYYLLSSKPSGKYGVIGWIKASQVSSRLHLAIDNDPKTFIIKGSGFGFSRAWGGKKDQVYSNLNTFENCEFKVTQTDKVGKGLWYRGLLGGEQIWIHRKHLKDLDL